MVGGGGNRNGTAGKGLSVILAMNHDETVRERASEILAETAQWMS